jgi:hypothetical protein
VNGSHPLLASNQPAISFAGHIKRSLAPVTMSGHKCGSTVPLFSTARITGAGMTTTATGLFFFSNKVCTVFLHRIIRRIRIACDPLPHSHSCPLMWTRL